MMQTLFGPLSFDLADACGTDPVASCRLIFNLTGSEAAAAAAEFVIRPIKVLLILLVAWILTGIARRLIDRGIARLAASQERVDLEGPEAEPGGPARVLRMLAVTRAEQRTAQIERRSQRAETLGSIGRQTSSLVIFGIAVLVALGELDISLGPLLAGAGVIGIALGFGAQSLVRDFLSGIFMLIEDQYGVGDIVDVGEASGRVEEVKLRTTKIRDVNGTLWHVPNGEIHRVANKSQEWARAVLDIEVAYDTDLDHAMSVIKRVADELWQEGLPETTILEEPQVWGVENFGDSSIAIRLVLKVQPSEQFATAREMRRRLKAAFDGEGIEIPFPQRTVWLHQVGSTVSSEDPGAEVTPKGSGGS